MIRSLTAQIVIAITAIVFLALALTSFLNYFKFERSFSIFLSSRFEAVLQDMKNSVETSLALGLPLNALRNTQPLIEREKNQDDQILSIEVFEFDGNVVFATDRSFVGDLISEQWLETRKLSQDQNHWSLREDDALVIGVPLVNSLDIEVGGIALRFSRAFYDQTLRDMMLDLLKSAAMILLITVAGAAVGSSLLLKNTSRSFSSMASALRSVLKERKSVLETSSHTIHAASHTAMAAQSTSSEPEGTISDPEDTIQAVQEISIEPSEAKKTSQMSSPETDILHANPYFPDCLAKGRAALKDIDEAIIAIRRLDEQG